MGEGKLVPKISDRRRLLGNTTHSIGMMGDEESQNEATMRRGERWV